MTDPDWLLRYEGYDAGQEGQRETLCALGNGIFCTRGAAPDAVADAAHYPGTYLAGVYNRLTSTIEGREIENEDLVNIPNWLVLVIRIDDGPWLRPADLEYIDYRQELDLRCGILTRNLRFRDAAGRITRWQERRLVSMADQHFAAIEVTLTPENWQGKLHLRSAIDGAVINSGVARYRKLRGRHLETLDMGAVGADAVWLMCRTVQSRIEIAQAARTRLYVDERLAEGADVLRETVTQPDLIAQDVARDAVAGQAIRVEKIVAIFTSHDRGISQAGLAAREAIALAPDFAALLDAHTRAWEHQWEQFDLQLDVDEAAAEGESEAVNHADHKGAQMKLRVHLFHLLQTVSPHTTDRDAGVPPRGWHGEAYRAHIMWDEIFIFPLLDLRAPVRTRSLLRYRHRRLPAARRLAREAGFKGAMFPWQSGSDGREESQILHLNPHSGRWIPDTSNRQRHIGSAVAYNVWQYYEVTGDDRFLNDYGAEMLVEVARFWASIAAWNPERGRYDIRGVMGPDEFQTAYPGTDPTQAGGLDNNAYTNVLATWVLNRARDALEILPPDCARRLRERLGVTMEEIEHWYDVSRKLFVPFHGDGIISQFEGYDDLKEFDWDGARAKYGDIQRLDRILEAEGDDTNDYKVSKQADVLMLFYLFSAEELQQLFEQLGYPFDPWTIPRNVEYYLARTSHGSTLSSVVHAWVLARTDRRHSWRLFQGALDSDIADAQGGTTAEGIHLGAMAGTIDLVQRCYIGIEMRGNVLYFNPTLPDNLRRLRARMRYREHELELDVTAEALSISSRRLTAEPITIAYRGRFRTISPGSAFAFRLIKPQERDRRDDAAADGMAVDDAVPEDPALVPAEHTAKGAST